MALEAGGLQHPGGTRPCTNLRAPDTITYSAFFGSVWISMVLWQQGVRMRKLQIRVEWYCPTCFFSALNRTPCRGMKGTGAQPQACNRPG
jgi:hypothetical protein